jgi:DNA-directed RNA polymerase specialized sigma24 family protein
MNLAENRDENEVIKILHRIDYSSKEIGDVVGMPDGTVRRRISEMREEGEIDD